MSDQFYILTTGSGLKTFLRGGVQPNGAVSVPEADWIAQRESAVANAASASVASMPVLTYKADIWRRCSEEQAEALHNLLSQRPIKEQMVFNGASVIDHADPLFQSIYDAITQAFDKATADKLLAPSA